MLLFKNLLFTAIAPGTVGVLLPWLLVRGSQRAPGAGLVVAVLLALVGASIYAASVWEFATRGRGTPAPIDAPKRLVVRSLYRYSRNPMYVGVLTIIAGWAMAYRSAAVTFYAVAVAGMFRLFIKLYEEPHLQQEFGAEYDVYRATVGRWFPRRRYAAPEAGRSKNGMR